MKQLTVFLLASMVCWQLIAGNLAEKDSLVLRNGDYVVFYEVSNIDTDTVWYGFHVNEQLDGYSIVQRNGNGLTTSYMVETNVTGFRNITFLRPLEEGIFDPQSLKRTPKNYTMAGGALVAIMGTMTLETTTATGGFALASLEAGTGVGAVAGTGVILLELIPPVAVATAVVVTVYYIGSNVAADLRGLNEGLRAFAQLVVRIQASNLFAAGVVVAVLNAEQKALADKLGAALYTATLEWLQQEIQRMNDPNQPNNPRNRRILKILLKAFGFTEAGDILIDGDLEGPIDTWTEWWRYAANFASGLSETEKEKIQQLVNQNRMKTILWVEDNEQFIATIQDSVSPKLAKAGFKIVIAKSYLEYQEQITKFVPDAIITDMMIPYGSGDAEIDDEKAQGYWIEQLTEAKPFVRNSSGYGRSGIGIIELFRGRRSGWTGGVHAGKPFDFLPDMSPQESFKAWVDDEESNRYKPKTRVGGDRLAYMPGIAPWGRLIFESHYATTPTIMITNQHAHSTSGTSILALMQLTCQERYGPNVIPFGSIDDFRDPRMWGDCQKTYPYGSRDGISDRAVEDLIASIEMQSEQLKEKGEIRGWIELQGRF